MGLQLNVFVNTIIANVFNRLYLVFLYLNATICFEVGSPAKFHVLLQLLLFLVLFYLCLHLVYFSLYILLSPCLFVIL